MAPFLGDIRQAATPAAQSRVNEVIWSDTALAQLEAIGAYVEQFNPMAAKALAMRLIAAGDGLATFPHRGRPVARTSMRELVTVNPYIIRYEVIGDQVHILRIRHGSRRPTVP